MTGLVRRRLVLVVAGLAMVAAACGSGEADESTPAAPAATPTAAAVEPTPTVEADEPTAGDAELGAAMDFIAHIESGDQDALVALLAPEYREQSFGIQTAAQFWTFLGRFGAVPEEPTACERVAMQVACSWRGTDKVTSILGYQLQVEYLFSFEDGAITKIDYLANDTPHFVAMTTWLDETHPGEPACNSTREELNAYYGGPGVLMTEDGEVFGDACVERMIEYAAEYRDSGLYIAPPEG